VEEEEDVREPIVVDGPQGVAIAESNENIHRLIDLRARRFQAITIVYGIVLSVVLGFNAIRAQQAVNLVKAQTAVIASQRVASCQYTKDFVSIFKRWAVSFAARAPQSAASSAIGRKLAFKTLLNDLSGLGSKTCLTAPVVPK
jgi:hypothetical protein